MGTYKTVFTKSVPETQKLGKQFVQGLKGGEVIGLIGDLGSGKTTFVQGMAKGLGVKERVISPTFVFIRSYTLDPKPYTLYHIDLYRIDSVEEAKVLGLEEIWLDPQNIVVIEWAEKIESILPKKTVKIYCEYMGENQRKIRIMIND
jgi:tRNA threonylcarbamoyladenosine biosynthesis protein TsaE